MPSFVEVVQEEIQECQKIIQIHSEAGENAVVPIEQMFPHGISDVTYTIFMKAARAIGYEISGDEDRVREEVRDIVNYCGFLLALLRKRDWS